MAFFYDVALGLVLALPVGLLLHWSDRPGPWLYACSAECMQRSTPNRFNIPSELSTIIQP